MKRILLIVMVVLLSCVTMASASSLWSGNGLFSDRKAYRIGDSITILISETSTARRTGDTSNGKTSSVGLPDGTGKLKFIPALGASYNDQFKSSGSINNTNTVTARISAQVKDIQPNGYLVIEGQQVIKQGKDEQKITIAGIIRPDDVQVDNTVLSTFIANADIKIEGKGPLARKQRQGILSSVFNFLF